jgi:hypothetical protein
MYKPKLLATVHTKKEGSQRVRFSLSAYLGGHDADHHYSSRDKKIAKNTAETALLATAALAIAYDSRCRSYLHFPRAGVEHLARLFFLPAMRLRASSGHALHNDGNDECVATVLLCMRSKDPWVLLAEHLGGRHISAYKILFREMIQALHDFWYGRLTDLERHESDVLRWADLIGPARGLWTNSGSFAVKGVLNR